MKIILGTMTFGDQVDIAGARAMIEEFQSNGFSELDTAYKYCDGKTEEILGEVIDSTLRKEVDLATKVHPWTDSGLKPEEIHRQFEESLVRLRTDYVDLLYLHAPDLNSPIKESLEVCNNFHQAGKLKNFGLSNYAAWQVAEVVEICRSNGWLQPNVYQGMYNGLTRDVERELLPCLINYGMKFYAYNPLAGGLLTGKHTSQTDEPVEGRFKGNQMYLDRYWKPDYFKAIDHVGEVCERSSVAPVSAALRWLVHHSSMVASRGDGIIVGGSQVDHLKENLSSCGDGPLPSLVVEAMDSAWEVVRLGCPKYFRP